MKLSTTLEEIRKLRRGGELREALRVGALIHSDEMTPIFLFELASIAQAAGNLVLAAEYWSEVAVRDCPQRTAALSLLGSTQRRRGMANEAALAFEAALSNETIQFEDWVYTGYVEVLNQIGSEQKSVQILLKGLKNNPESNKIRKMFLTAIETGRVFDVKTTLEHVEELGVIVNIKEILQLLMSQNVRWDDIRPTLMNCINNRISKQEISRLVSEAERHGDLYVVEAAILSAYQNNIILEPWYSTKLAVAKSKIGREADETANAYKQAIIDNPNRRDLVLEWSRYAIRAYGMESTPKLLIELQSNSDRPLPAVMLEIARQHGLHTLTNTFDAHIKKILSEPSATNALTSFASIWAGDLSLKDFDTSLESIPLSVLELLFLVGRSNFRTFTSESWDAAASILLIDRGHINSTVNSLLPPVSANLQYYITHSKYIDESAKAFFSEKERYVSYQDKIAQSKTFEVIDPFTGKTTWPIDSFLIYDKIIYTFKSTCIWHVVTGGPAGDVQGIWFPLQNVVIVLQKQPPTGLGRASLSTTLSELLRRFWAAGPQPKSLLETNVDADRQIIACVAGVENYAHQLWNSFSGLYRQKEQGLLASYSEINFFGSEFFGDVRSLFPDLSNTFTTKYTSRQRLGPACFSIKRLLVSVGGHFMTRGLLNSVVEHAKQHSKVDEDFIRGTIIAIALRTGDRAWENQEENVINLIKILSLKFTDLVFLLDVFAKPSGDDYVSLSWALSTSKLDESANRIKAAFPESDNILILSDLDLNSSISLMQSVCCYVSPIGTLQHKYGWLTGASGVVYVAESWQLYARNMLPGMREGEILKPPCFMFGAAKDSGSKRSLHDARPHLHNVSLGAAAVAEKIISCINERR